MFTRWPIILDVAHCQRQLDQNTSGPFGSFLRAQSYRLNANENTVHNKHAESGYLHTDVFPDIPPDIDQLYSFTIYILYK